MSLSSWDSVIWVPNLDVLSISMACSCVAQNRETKAGRGKCGEHEDKGWNDANRAEREWFWASHLQGIILGVGESGQLRQPLVCHLREREKVVGTSR